MDGYRAAMQTLVNSLHYPRVLRRVAKIGCSVLYGAGDGDGDDGDDGGDDGGYDGHDSGHDGVLERMEMGLLRIRGVNRRPEGR